MRLKSHHSSLPVMLACAAMAYAQTPPRGALRFAGKVKRGQEFHRDIGRGLVFTFPEKP
jgi:hypothetical protein